MHRCCTFIVLILSMSGIACPVHAQSPYRLAWHRDGWIIGGAAALGVAASSANNSIEPLTAREIGTLSRESVNPFDRSATHKFSEGMSAASDIVVVVALASPFALLLDKSVRGDWRTLTVMYAETMALAIILPALGKSAVERNRPYVYNPDAPLDEKVKRDARSSFFSRHATMAFASGVFLSTAFNDYYPHSRSKSRILAGSLLGATVVGVMRYESGMHFPSDIIAGAIVGSVIGYAVPRLHRVNNERVDVVPYWTGSEYGVALRFLIP